MEIYSGRGKLEIWIRRRPSKEKRVRFDPIGTVRHDEVLATVDQSRAVFPIKTRKVRTRGGNFEWNLPFRIVVSITYYSELAYDIATALNAALMRREEEAPRLRQTLINDGWSEGRDGLWRNERFGGSYKFYNALRRIGSQHGEETRLHVA